MTLNSLISYLHSLSTEIAVMCPWTWLEFVIIYDLWRVACWALEMGQGLLCRLISFFLFFVGTPWIKYSYAPPFYRRKGLRNVLECTQAHKVRRSRDRPPPQSSGGHRRFAWTFDLWVILLSSDLCCHPMCLCCKSPSPCIFLVYLVIGFSCIRHHLNELTVPREESPSPGV